MQYSEALICSTCRVVWMRFTLLV